MSLIKDIEAWESDDAAHQAMSPSSTTPPKPGKLLFKPTNNVSRETFNTVRDNPGRTRVEITLMLQARGFNKSSVSSLLGQMVRQKMLREIDGHVYAVGKEYTPVKAYATTKNKLKPKPKTRPKDGIAALPAATEQTQALEKAKATLEQHIQTAWDAKSMIDHLSVRQARALYEELKSIFGEQ